MRVIVLGIGGVGGLIGGLLASGAEQSKSENIFMGRIHTRGRVLFRISNLLFMFVK